MPRLRTLHDPATGKTCSTRLDGARTEVRQGLPGREKVAVRDHDDASTACRWAVKEEWSRLKKGMALLNPDASWGEPRLHRFIGGAYTGAMAIAADGGGGLFCNRSAEAEEMVHAGFGAGVPVGFARLERGLVWKAARMPDTGAVLLQVDGGVVRWMPEAGTLEEVLAYRHNPGFLSVAGSRLACYDGTAAVVLDLADGAELLRVPALAELHGGHSPQMEGALSRDGRLLALCVRPGEIMVFDVASGQLHLVLPGDFAMVRQMDFLPGDRLLVAEDYGRWSLRCFDLATGQPDPAWTELGIDGGAVAVSPSGRRVAVAQRGTVGVHAFGAGTPPRSFVLEHVVKRCAMTWTADDALAVRTDYGCASVYAVA